MGMSDDTPEAVLDVRRAAELMDQISAADTAADDLKSALQRMRDAEKARRDLAATPASVRQAAQMLRDVADIGSPA